MDIPTVNMGGVFKGANSGQVVPKPKASADVPAPKPEVKLPVKVEAPEVKVQEDNARYEAVRRAAEALKNTYAVSDVRFTIFKDVAGEYITRFTSLRDGSVSYYPQKTLFKLTEGSGGEFSGLVQA